MRAEYIRFLSPQVKYGQKAILESQLNLLSSLKHLREYKNLRDQELILKIHLKKKVEELRSSMDLLERALPKTQFKEEKQQAQEIIKEAIMVPSMLHDEKKELSLEQELESIRRKLARIQ